MIGPATGPTGSASAAPVLRRPLDGELISGIPQFSWSSVLPPGALYELQVWPFDGTPVGVVQTTEPRWFGALNLVPGIYNWRVLVLDEKGAVVAGSEPFTFTWAD